MTVNVAKVLRSLSYIVFIMEYGTCIKRADVPGRPCFLCITYHKIASMEKLEAIKKTAHNALVIFFPTFCGESYELRFAIRTFPVIVLSTIISQNMVPFSRELK